MASRRFEFEGSKFWDVDVAGSKMTVRFGKVGTSGQAQVKDFADEAAATKAAEKLIREKTGKGYVEQRASAGVDARSKAAAKATAKSPASTETKENGAEANATATKTVAAKDAGHPAVSALLAAISKKLPKLAATLRPGADDAALRTLGDLGAPGALVALYASHDGSDDELFPPYSLLSVVEIDAERKTMNDLLQKDASWREHRLWKPEWIPFFGRADGQLLCFDPVGGTDGGPAGQIIFYDHETGPAREFASLDVLLDLLTALAQKKLLDQRVQEESPEAYQQLHAKAKNVGLPKMPPKELKKVISKYDDLDSDIERLGLVLPLARHYGAERDLWSKVADTASNLQNWPLVATSVANVVRLTPSNQRPFMDGLLAFALHRTGRDAEALATLKTALTYENNYPESLLSEILRDGDPSFSARALVVATETKPKSAKLWLRRGIRATDPAERRMAFDKVVELTRDAPSDNSVAKAAKALAAAYVKLDRVEALEGKAKLDGLSALATSIEKEDIALTALAASGIEGSPSQRFWLLVVEHATKVGDWATVASAAGRVLKHCLLESDEYLHVHHRVRALHELGRDDEALEALKAALSNAMFASGDEVLKAIPTQLDRAFAAKCFATATKVMEDNAFLWNGVAANASTSTERNAALKRCVDLCSDPSHVPNPKLAPQFFARDKKRYDAHMALKEKAQAQL